MSETILYKFDDKLLFRKDELGPFDNANGKNVYDQTELNEGFIISFHCVKHPEIELVEKDIKIHETHLFCPKCKSIVYSTSGKISYLEKQVISLLHAEKFKNAKLVRLDDWYIPELKVEIKGEKTTITNKAELPSNYKVVCDVKKDKDEDTMIMIQVFKNGEQKGTQIFVKPEKKQLSTDHNNPDPATIISRIEVKLNDRVLTHDFNKKKYE